MAKIISKTPVAAAKDNNIEGRKQPGQMNDRRMRRLIQRMAKKRVSPHRDQAARGFA